MTTTTTVRVETTQYQGAHGRMPRGRGLWFFAFDRGVEATFAATGTFAEARSAAVVEALRVGAHTVRVAP